jgi:hypothetical protein
VDDLVQWFGQQLDEDERIARRAGGMAWLEWADGGWVETAHVSKTEWKGPGDDGRHVASVRVAEDRAHIVRHDPARVLREIDAKRKIIAEHDVYSRPLGERMDCQSYDFPCTTLRLLALPYADRPGYREEWRP